MISGKPKNMSSNRKVNTCSRCGRPSRGHIGPQGPKCNMMLDNVEAARTPSKRALDFDRVSESSNSGNEAVLRELTNQLGQMSINMQHMQEEWKEMKNERRLDDREDSNPRGIKKAVMASDISTSKASAGDEFVCLPSGAKVTQKNLKLARSGEFVN
jgi:hypothetical protein